MADGVVQQPANALARPLRALVAELAEAAPDWAPIVDDWAARAPGLRAAARIERDLGAGERVYPADPFRALKLTRLAEVRVVIVGQDPYHGPGQAEGLAFSVPDGQPWPPSLRNIFAEAQRDLGGQRPAGRGSLLGWARQGVLLLNTSLTVLDRRPASHGQIGWEALTDDLIAQLVRDARPKAFLLWGAHAQAKAAPSASVALPGEPERGASGMAGEGRHLILRSNHPSPLSARRPPVPFIGNGHFGAVNAWLAARGSPGIDWLEKDK